MTSMEINKICPSCSKEIKASSAKCPECNAELQIRIWEIRFTDDTESADNTITFSGENSVNTIRESLLAGKVNLSQQTRQYTKNLESVVDDELIYESTNETEWMPLIHFANRETSLLSLYDPSLAYGQMAMYLFGGIAGVLYIVAANMELLLHAGANFIVAMIISIILSLLTPTVVGLFIASFIVGAIYKIPFVTIAMRAAWSILIGLIVGGAVGLFIGFPIGWLFGLTQKKLLVAPILPKKVSEPAS